MKKTFGVGMLILIILATGCASHRNNSFRYIKMDNQSPEKITNRLVIEYQQKFSAACTVDLTSSTSTEALKQEVKCYARAKDAFNKRVKTLVASLEKQSAKYNFGKWVSNVLTVAGGSAAIANISLSDSPESQGTTVGALVAMVASVFTSANFEKRFSSYKNAARQIDNKWTSFCAKYPVVPADKKGFEDYKIDFVKTVDEIMKIYSDAKKY